MKNKLTRKEKEILYRAATLVDYGTEFSCFALENAQGNAIHNVSFLQIKYGEFFDLKLSDHTHECPWDRYDNKDEVKCTRVLMLLLFAEVGPL